MRYRAVELSISTSHTRCEHTDRVLAYITDALGGFSEHHVDAAARRFAQKAIDEHRSARIVVQYKPELEPDTEWKNMFVYNIITEGRI